MDEDALDVARKAVAATRVWREQMRHDWPDYREPEEILDAAVGELLAERDRLRAVVEAARRTLDRTDDEQWSIDHNALVDLGAALDALDVSAVMGEDDKESDRG